MKPAASPKPPRLSAKLPGIAAALACGLAAGWVLGQSTRPPEFDPDVLPPGFDAGPEPLAAPTEPADAGTPSLDEDSLSCEAPPAPPVRPEELVCTERPEPPGPRDPFAFASFEGQPALPVGEEAAVNGMSMQIAQLTVDAPLERVTEYYIAQLRRAGHSPMGGNLDQQSDGPRYLSFHVGDAGELDTLTLVPTDDGTQVFAGRTRTPKLDVLTTEARLPPDVPAPSHPSQVVVTEFLEAGRRQRTISFLLSGTDRDRALEFYARALTARGFKPDQDRLTDGKTLRSQSYSGPSSEVNVSADGLADGTVQVSLVLVDH